MTERPEESGTHTPFVKQPYSRRQWPKILMVIAVCCIAVGVAIFVLTGTVQDPGPVLEGRPGPNIPAEPVEPPRQSDAIDLPAQIGVPFYPTDNLFITVERADYQSGEMILTIPRLDYSGPVLENVTQFTLEQGIGLYDYAQPPGAAPEDRIDNHNISIAGHRDIYGCEFYYIDTIDRGDELYIDYQGRRYTYRWLETRIIEPDDWSVIYNRAYPCVTLTSCDPIGVADKRIMVCAELISVEDRQQ